jgi:ATP-dependent RNA helicase DeaD
VLLVPYTKRRIAERLLESAGVDAEWSGPPTADEIRAKDQVRLLEDPILTEDPSPDDLTLAQRILADRTPEQVAAALIRLHRSRLPEPEEMVEDIRDRDLPSRPERGPRPERRPAYNPLGGEGGGAWFRMGVGRTNNADPKWLVPLICRLGHVTKKDIGEIRIFDRETKFEIAPDAEGRFREAIKAASAAGDMRVEPAGSPGPRAERPKHSGPRPPRGKGPPPRRPNAGPGGPPPRRPKRKAN